MLKAMLISNSYVYGGRLLSHCLPAIKETLDGVDQLLFIPYAQKDWDGYTRLISGAFSPIGVSLDSVVGHAFPCKKITEAKAVFVGGGNTFLLLDTLYRFGLVEILRNRCLAGMPYIGSSAGSNIACPTIATTNDMPIVWPPSFRALGIVPFNINPHFVERIAETRHMGESREDRIAEFHQVHSVPVIGLREGSWLEVSRSRVDLRGGAGAMVFCAGKGPVSVLPGDDLEKLGIVAS